ncbi:uncharacterized protein LOC135846999 [Planococcus citri]|uniref:uncharacterized protein LOC135846999 n=1 Tax=Planococcus citri TaxID=170843 RepID=UPI0031F7A364
MPKAPYLLLLIFILEYSITLHVSCCANDPSISTEYKTALSKQTKRRSVKITDASDFLGLVKNSDAFIDKTMLIKEIMDHKEKVILITRPHKWAKSVNMDMLKLFLQMKLDKRGRPLSKKNKTKQRILFESGEYTLHYTKGRLQQPLLISNYPEFIQEHQGQYPMIHVKMELTLSRGCTFTNFLKSIRAIISGTFRSHDYLKHIFEKARNDTRHSKSQMKKYAKFLLWFKKMTAKDYMALDKLHSSFVLLSKMLHDHFGKPVVILMDDYDAPLQYVLRNKDAPNVEKQKFIQFYQNFLHDTFKLNPHIKKGVLAGNLRLYKEELFYEYKIPYPRTCVDDQFYEYFGFTAIEAGWLFDYRNVSKDIRGKVRNLYFGYQPTNNPSLKIYNVHSFSSFLDEKKYKNYWSQSDLLESYLSQFLKAASFKETCTALTYGNEISIHKADLRFNATDFLRLQNFMNDYNKVPENFPALALSYLFSTGYLTTDYTQDETVYLRFPNRQIAQEIRVILSRNYRLKLGVAEAHKAKPLIEQFRRFVLYDQNNTNELAVTLTRFLAPRSPRKVDQLLLRQTINYLAIYIDSCDRFSQQSDDLPDLILLDRDEAIIFKCTVDASSALIALAEAKIYEHVLQNVRNIQTVKYVGINLNPRKQVQIKVESQPNQYYDPDIELK